MTTTNPAADLLFGFPADLLDPGTPPRWSPERETYDVFTYGHVGYLTRDPHRVFSQSYGDPKAHPLNGFVWAADPPEHGRLREPIADAFKPRGVATLMPAITGAVRALAADCTAGGILDLARFATRLPNRVICGLLDIEADVEEENVGRLLAEHAGSTTTAAPPNGDGWWEWARALLEEKRRRPGHGLIDHLLAVQASGYPLTDAEIESNIAGMVSAGTDTTAAQIASVVLWLAQHELLGPASRYSDFRRTAIEEVLRIDPAFPAVRIQSTAEVRFGDFVVPAGQPVTGWISAANRDPAAFGPTAGDVDYGRNPNPHLTFVKGRHSCLGAPLARAELDITVQLLPQLLPGLRIDPDVPVQRHHGIVHSFTTAQMPYNA